jgi:hypothetical protein
MGSIHLLGGIACISHQLSQLLYLSQSHSQGCDQVYCFLHAGYLFLPVSVSARTVMVLVSFKQTLLRRHLIITLPRVDMSCAPSYDMCLSIRPAFRSARRESHSLYLSMYERWMDWIRLHYEFAWCHSSAFPVIHLAYSRSVPSSLCPRTL